ncbi:MAG: hypothetical protein K8R55_04655, partial [Desulfuromonadaceae bacterium]|nr:hypothetical protein [Desulfuromonadaceae bacterium]
MRGHWLDIDHTAVHFGVSPKTVSGWIRKSLLPTTVIEGEEIVAEKRLGTWYIDVDSVKFRKPVADIALADERKRTEAATRKIEEDRGRSRKIEEDRG